MNTNSIPQNTDNSKTELVLLFAGRAREVFEAVNTLADKCHLTVEELTKELKRCQQSISK